MAVGYVIKDVATLIIEIRKPSRHDCELCAGDRRIRRECVFIHAVYNADIVKRFDFLVEPAIRLDVLKRAV